MPETKTKATHTPGPWASQRWNSRDGGWPAVAAVGDGYGYYVAHCSDYHASEEENEANARLIAAAPDLLAACQAYDAVWLEFEPRGPDAGAGRLAAQTISLWNQIRAAIAKALGGK